MLFLRNKCNKSRTAAFFCVFACFFLTGCEEKLTPSYLMRHPAILKKELDGCRFVSIKPAAERNRCEVILYAAANVESLINEIRESPEKFGQKILDEEIECVKTKSLYHQWQQELDVKKAQKGSFSELKLMEEKLETAKKTYQDQREKVQILLAVIGMGSPE